MKKVVSILATIIYGFCFVACGNRSATTADSSENEDNVLTEAEKSEGYTLLFNGKDFTGWHLYNSDVISGWAIEDGCMVGLNQGGAEGTGMVTDKDYHNFQIKWDWKIEPGGNSGFLYHVVEDPKYKMPFENAPEYQIIDDDNYQVISETGKSGLEDWQKTGCNYAMHVPEHKKVNAPGQWNSSMLVYKDGRVEHWLNGEKILEFEEGTDDWNQRRNSGKWEAFPDYGISNTGKLCFQDHGSRSYFKNVKIKVQ